MSTENSHPADPTALDAVLREFDAGRHWETGVLPGDVNRCGVCGRCWPCPDFRFAAEVVRLRAEVEQWRVSSAKVTLPGVEWIDDPHEFWRRQAARALVLIEREREALDAHAASVAALRECAALLDLPDLDEYATVPAALAALQSRLAAMEQRAESAESDWRRTEKQLWQYQELYSDAMRRIAAAEADSKRLDWLDDQSRVLVRLAPDKLIVTDVDAGPGWTKVALHFDEWSLYGGSIREGIDAAIEALPPQAREGEG